MIVELMFGILVVPLVAAAYTVSHIEHEHTENLDEEKKKLSTELMKRGLKIFIPDSPRGAEAIMLSSISSSTSNFLKGYIAVSFTRTEFVSRTSAFKSPQPKSGTMVSDPFLIVQVGDSVRRTKKIVGVFNSKSILRLWDGIQLSFELPARPTACILLLMFGKKIKYSDCQNSSVDKLLAVGHASIFGAITAGHSIVKLPLATKKGKPFIDSLSLEVKPVLRTSASLNSGSSIEKKIIEVRSANVAANKGEKEIPLTTSTNASC